MTEDVIYDSSPLPALRKAFPGMTVESAIDTIHDDRWRITVPASPREYFREILRTGYGECSFRVACVLARHSDPKDDPDFAEVKAALDDLKAEEARKTQ